MAHLLVVEGEAELRHLLVLNLEAEGFSVAATGDGIPALFAHLHRRADLMVLGLKLPSMNAYQVLEHLRKAHDHVPALLLTRRGAEADRLKGLALGADDCLVKPFSHSELVARIKAILRRARILEPARIFCGPYRFDFGAMTAFKDGLNLELTPQELRILESLVKTPGRTLSRAELLAQAWEPDARPSPRTVDVHVAKLRKKLGDTPATHLITTVGGEGYRWTG